MSIQNEILTEALLAHAPKIAEEYKRIVRNVYAQIIEQLGPRMKGIYNDRNWVRTFKSMIEMNLAIRTDISEDRVIDEERLERNARQYAEASVLKWKEKIQQKLGELDSVEVPYLQGEYFIIKGEKNGNRVVIEQQMILCRSSRGMLFNKFPSRIYLNKKFISEAKFKKEFNIK